MRDVYDVIQSIIVTSETSLRYSTFLGHVTKIVASKNDAFKRFFKRHFTYDKDTFFYIQGTEHIKYILFYQIKQTTSKFSKYLLRFTWCVLRNFRANARFCLPAPINFSQKH